MVNKKYFEVLQWASSFLEKQNKEGAAAEFLLVGRQRWTKTDLVTRMRQVVPSEILEEFKQDVHRFSKGEPAQYILGYGDFYGRDFSVTKDTLIPRPETEELVELCLKNHLLEEKLKVVDVGTGTGAIAITLKKERPNWQVQAVDISKKALLVAQENSQLLHAEIRFIEGDLLTPLLLKNEKVDIIISNPPYIGKQEWAEMDESVRKNEPSLALFAENDGYELYERLAQQAPAVIKKNGEIYLEIGYQQGEKVKEIFQRAFPEKKVSIHKDLNGLNRIVRVCG